MCALMACRLQMLVPAWAILMVEFQPEKEKQHEAHGDESDGVRGDRGR
jgi:hypothetical protein